MAVDKEKAVGSPAVTQLEPWPTFRDAGLSRKDVDVLLTGIRVKNYRPLSFYLASRNEALGPFRGRRPSVG